MHDPIDSRLGSILAERRGRAAQLGQRLEAWEGAAGALRGLLDALVGLAAHPNAPAGLARARDLLSFADLPGRIDREVTPRLMRVRQRFSRTTINIGASAAP